VPSDAAPDEQRLGNGRLLAWLLLAGLLAVGGYAIASASFEPTGDEAYRYSTAILGILVTGLMLALVLWITPGIRVRDVLALRRPIWPGHVLALRRPLAWPWALKVGSGIVVGSFAFSYLCRSSSALASRSRGCARAPAASIRGCSSTGRSTGRSPSSPSRSADRLLEPATKSRPAVATISSAGMLWLQRDGRPEAPVASASIGAG
jgi:hypothetical protein